MVFSNWLSSAKPSALKTYILVTLNRLSKLHLGIYMYVMYMHTVTSGRKEATNLKERKEVFMGAFGGRSGGDLL